MPSRSTTAMVTTYRRWGSTTTARTMPTSIATGHPLRLFAWPHLVLTPAAGVKLRSTLQGQALVPRCQEVPARRLRTRSSMRQDTSVTTLAHPSGLQLQTRPANRRTASDPGSRLAPAHKATNSPPPAQLRLHAQLPQRRHLDQFARSRHTATSLYACYQSSYCLRSTTLPTATTTF